MTYQFPNNRLKYSNSGYIIFRDPIYSIDNEKWPLTKILMGETQDVQAFRTLWEVKYNKLYLNKLDAKISFEKKVEMDYFFGTSEPFFVDWYSGILWACNGIDMLDSNPFLYQPLFEYNIFLKIEKGVVLKTKEIWPKDSKEFVEYDQKVVNLSENFYKDYISKFYEAGYFPE